MLPIATYMHVVHPGLRLQPEDKHLLPQKQEIIAAVWLARVHRRSTHIVHVPYLTGQAKEIITALVQRVMLQLKI